MGGEEPKGIVGKLGGWVGLASAVLTIGLTSLNAYWSRQISVFEAGLKAREADLKDQQVKLEGERDRLARYTFVHTLFDGVLNQNAAQKTLTVNLISLALGERDAKLLFAGLQASDDPQARDVGTLGSDAVELSNLVLKMDDAVKESRIGAVESLIQRYRNNPIAVDQAIRLLESPKVQSLSASGRINALVFLQSAEAPAWNSETILRAQDAIAGIRRRSEEGTSAIGHQTETELRKLSKHLEEVKK